VLRRFLILTLAIIGMTLPLSVTAQATDRASSKIAVVVMHGKGGSPDKHVASLASSLQEKGYLVANLEMPWSGKRDYDADVSAAEQEVVAAFAALREKGAQKLFIAGHSQGGLFAVYYGGKHPVDGVIAIAPGGNVGSAIYKEKLGESVSQARSLVAAGKGGEKTRFEDFENARGSYPVTATAAAYLNWFDPDGAMNLPKAVRSMPAQTPVLWIVAKKDYPGLRLSNLPLFDSFPRNPLTRLYEPESNHIGAPAASRDEIANWIAEVANRPPG